MIVKRNEDISYLKELMDNILTDIHKSGPVSACHLETLACIKKFYPDLFKDYEHQLMYLMGLFSIKLQNLSLFLNYPISFIVIQ